MPAGRHFLQIPGPTNVPDRVLRAIDRPTIDHRGPEFQAIGKHARQRAPEQFNTFVHRAAGDMQFAFQRHGGVVERPQSVLARMLSQPIGSLFQCVQNTLFNRADLWRECSS